LLATTEALTPILQRGLFAQGEFAAFVVEEELSGPKENQSMTSRNKILRTHIGSETLQSRLCCRLAALEEVEYV